MTSDAPIVDGFTKDTLPAIIPGVSQLVAVTAGSLASSATSSDTSVVRCFSSVDCFLKFGLTPVATTSHMFLPGGIIEYFGITGGHSIAVISSSGTGTLRITEGA